jgi:hypothetical protein
MGVFIHSNGLQFKTIGHRQPEVPKYFFDTTDGEFAAIDWCRKLRHDMRQAADVVEVAVGNDICP